MLLPPSGHLGHGDSRGVRGEERGRCPGDRGDGGVAPAQDEACSPGMLQRVPPPPPLSGPGPPERSLEC
ncbi:hypothetical protein KUCAC02_031095 [Chaenocephalus aceratus]|uniref:Uncharacterized protein n=1 Tax=Chaenocephalus aceratus TaxID=36190 RepID=A0ACB9XLI5_CHAAC|nr:hypothetical protein KUCAC02_031095 [Chaenocephalus aceratus]